MHHRTGFTLIEILVSITIIAILLSVLFPVIAQVRERARQNTCLSNIRQIGTATLMYTQDFEETFPVGGDFVTVNTQDGVIQRGVRWVQAIVPYTGEAAHREVLVGKVGEAANLYEYTADTIATVFHCPSDLDDQIDKISYSCNALLAGNVVEYVDPPVYTASARLADVISPATVVWAGDSSKQWINGDFFAPTNWVRPEQDAIPPVAADSAPGKAFVADWLTHDYTDGTPGVAPWECPDGPWVCQGPAYRHHRTGFESGSANVVYCDGHARAAPFGSLATTNLYPK